MRARTLFLLLALLSAGCGGGSSPVPPEEVLFSNQFLNIAHRGGRGVRPEHTLVAYENAIVDGADVLELDVHATSDGVVVVMHDASVLRTTDGTGLIKDMTFEELRTLDAGYRFTEDGGQTFPFRGMGIQVPSLIEVFEAFPDTPYVIEVKQDEPSIAEDFVALCREYGIADQMIAAAFSAEVLVEVRAAGPEIASSMGESEVFDFFLLTPETEAGYTPPGQFLQVPPRFAGISVLTPAFLARAERFGLKVHVWTINDEAEMRSLLELPIDGMMTDYPGRLTGVLGR